MLITDNLHNENKGLKLAGSYLEARRIFHASAIDQNAHITSYENKHCFGVEGERLFCDIAAFGSSTAPKTMIISSGTHGIEGFCGNAIQSSLLRNGLSNYASDDLQILLVHAINPYGFSYFKRNNENNVDLNRNFITTNPRLRNDNTYELFRNAVFPKSWRTTNIKTIQQAIEQYISQFGLVDFQEKLTIGQYSWPEDPFYGGIQATWSSKLWMRICKSVSKHSHVVSHIDLHSGLGAYGSGELIFAAKDKNNNLNIAKQWYGSDGLQIPGDGECASSSVSGTLTSCLDHFNVVNVGVGLEFGTVPIKQMLFAVIEENWLAHNPDCSEQLKTKIRQQMKDAFLPSDNDWLEAIWNHTKFRVQQSISGLAEMEYPNN